MTKRDFVFPPSLNRARASSDWKEKRGARLSAIEVAMNALPLRAGVDSQIRGLSGLFEQTFHAVRSQLEGKPATTRKIETELKAFAKGLDGVAGDIESMHRDTVLSWARAGNASDAATNAAALYMLLKEAHHWSILSLDALKRAKRVGGRGRRTDAMAKEMRHTAAFIYESLTPRKANIAYDAIEDQELETDFVIFLNRVYEVYGISASSKSRARKRRGMAKK